MDDQHTTVEGLRRLVRAFVSEREWEIFHSPKDLAISVAIEAAELMEIFQWRNRDEPLEGEKMQHFKEELADVVIYCLAAANATGIDLSGAIREKIKMNALKYPRQQYRGKDLP
ncbi:MAG TPA: nucleotide pyrophosphohydrolase [Firmicutes bacterium]|jgi:dCTP diphosphatase|nr:nucleotide pyrophosphohydrolase [Bacillota bacterium]